MCSRARLVAIWCDRARTCVVEDVTDEDDELYNVRMRLGSSATRLLVTVDVDVAVDGMDQLIRQVFAATRCSSVRGTSREWLVASDLVSECEGGFHLDGMSTLFASS